MRRYIALVAFMLSGLFVTYVTSDVLYAWQTKGIDDDNLPATAALFVPQQLPVSSPKPRVASALVTPM